ncbi:nuclease-related domain-containing protein [Paenisporosarcina sp. NPDC076898]|uniref:nuclease-related domain-containing protein n=1 Tax=unclassified Paenisporosarcina TaxID=2642018 RepID=UPI003D006BCF
MKTYQLSVLRMCVLHSRAGEVRITEGEYRTTKAGFAGEEKVIQFLKEARLSKETLVFRNVLMDGTQIDILVVNPKFICVLEVKNITGELFFSVVNKQFYRLNRDGQKEGMRNPELQLQRAVNVLQRRLHSKAVDLRVRGMIILASRSGIVVESPQLFPAIPIDALTDRLENMEATSVDLLSNDDLKIVRKMMKREAVKVQDRQIFERLNIDVRNLRRGVRCTECFSIGMNRTYSTWICVRCGCRDKDAHFASLQEYQLLFGREITSKELKWWLGIDDRFLGLRILNHAHESYQFGPKNRLYLLKFEPWRLEQFLASEMSKR